LSPKAPHSAEAEREKPDAQYREGKRGKWWPTEQEKEVLDFAPDAAGLTGQRVFICSGERTRGDEKKPEREHDAGKAKPT
jgi:hypothetical protein